MSALLIEKNNWETSATGHQLQIPKDAFASFFESAGSIDVHVWVPPTAGTSHHQKLLLSHYSQSDTYRCNWMTQFGGLDHAVIVFEKKSDNPRSFDLWWFTGTDADTILSHPYDWNQAKASQYMPLGGRMWAIISAPAPRTV